MEQRCQECGAPLVKKKCDYCGAVSKKVKIKPIDKEHPFDPKNTRTDSSVQEPPFVSDERSNDQEELKQQEVPPIDKEAEKRARRQKRNIWIAIIAIPLLLIAHHLYQMLPPVGFKRIYTCDMPLTFVDEPSISAVITIESRGSTIMIWRERETFPRQAYIDYFWPPNFNPSNDDIRDWFEGSDNITDMDGTYWELVSIDDNYVITNFVFEYQNMSRADLNDLWEPNFDHVSHRTAIEFLEREGATCVRQ